MELSRHFFAEAKYENRNLPRHLPRQLPSAEANYEGWTKRRHVTKWMVN